MKNHFKKRGWIYLPVSVIGWIVTLVYAGIAVYTFVQIERGYNSLYSSFIRFFPYFISFTVVWFWIAGNTADKEKE